MTDATIIILVNVVCATIITVVTLLVRRDVNSLMPHVATVAEQLVEANKYIAQQGKIMTDLRDELAMRKPVMTTQRFTKDYEASPPYKKPDKQE